MISSTVLIVRRLLHQRLAVDDLDPLRLEREQHRQLDHVDAERLAEQPVLLELDADLLARPTRRGPSTAPRSVEMPARERSSPSHGQ